MACYPNCTRHSVLEDVLKDEREEKDLVPLHAQRSAVADGRRLRQDYVR